MSETKGPIERIREAVNYLASRMSTPQVESVADDVREACDELAAQQHAYVERHPYVWMLTTEEADAVMIAISKALAITGRDKTDGAALEKIAKEWHSLHDKPDRQALLATVSMAEWDCIFRALESMGMLSADEFDEMGRRIAKICAEWIDGKQASTPQPDRIDNGDGTVTFSGVSVTVPAAIVADGSTVLRVGVPKPGERYVLSDGTDYRICTDEKWLSTELRVILSAPPAPQFRAGGYYRTRGGEVVGPLEPNTAQEAADVTTWPWQVTVSDGVRTYTERGTVWSSDTSEHDLRLGEVTVWQPPASLKAGEYWWDGYGLYYVQVQSVNRIPSHAIADWINPPKIGRYTVPGGGKPATWEGDA